MTRFSVYTADNAPEASKPNLKAAKASFGFIPNLQDTITMPKHAHLRSFPAYRRKLQYFATLRWLRARTWEHQVRWFAAVEALARIAA